MTGHEAAAREWLDQDPDPATRAELADVLERAANRDNAALEDLDDRFGSRLGFGTAGLRGALGAGPNRMNRVLVAQAAAGFAAYLAERDAESRPEVVIGYDGRRNSEVFARDSAEIFAGAGLRALLLPRTVPTPVLAFAVRQLGADAGVMVTASHNPPGDNGYKVYLGGQDAGSQIVSPTDVEIADEIGHVADTKRVPDLPRADSYEIVGEQVIDDYVAATAAVGPAAEPAHDLRWVYTAMHGVGWNTLSRILRRAGYPDPELVTEQIDPDPAFPTVAFPNPEEPGAMDLALGTAERSGAELVIANDPDADRLAVAIPAEDGWRRLTGNEVGLLLGWGAARAAQGRPGASLACSMVSSPGLGVIAEHYGLDHYETLTGFKWISRAPGMVYGFEEALGYLVNPETVRDKDGISAAIAVLSLAAEARGRGTDLAGLLDEMSETFGHFGSGQVSIRMENVRIIDGLMDRLRTDPPTAFGERSVARADDLLARTDGPTGNLLRYWLDDGSRVIVRPSGTEPKLKVYLDVRGSTPSESAARIAALEVAAHDFVEVRQG